MAASKQAWLVAVGSSAKPLPNNWIRMRPDLLEDWPVEGGKVPRGIERGAPLIYYAADWKKLVAVGRSTGVVSDADVALRVQLYIAIPLIRWAPSWEVLGRKAEAIEGKMAITLEDDQYEAGLNSFLGLIRKRFPR
jgi:hypothetical protein